MFKEDELCRNENPMRVFLKEGVETELVVGYLVERVYVIYLFEKCLQISETLNLKNKTIQTPI